MNFKHKISCNFALDLSKPIFNCNEPYIITICANTAELKASL